MPLVPDVLDEITALAQRKLEAVGLKVGTISTEKNPGGIPGTVLRTSPDLRSSVPEGSAVDLVIIEAADALAVPNVVGLSQPNAEEQIKQAGLRVRNVFAEETINSPAGTVVRTSPGAGGRAAPNSGVDLVIARLAALTVMPDFQFKQVDATVKFLTERGFHVEVEGVAGHPHDGINKQDPPAGSPLEPGQLIRFRTLDRDQNA
jgi:beta-lactam-binding protein with PASTA domain